MTGKEHARLLGLLFWIFTGFQVVLIGFIGIIYLVIFGAVFSQIPHRANEPGPEIILPFLILIMVILFVMTLLFSVPKVVAGYGLRHEKSWARIWAIIACCMAVMSVPLGTALGVYGLIFLLGDEGKGYFESPDYGRLSPVTNPAINPAINPPAPHSWQ